MARPCMSRRIEQGFVPRTFKPLGVPMRELDLVTLSIDGMEALRLADVEGLYHEEAAARMGVSRATFGRILEQARRAVAEAIVTGKALAVDGGTVSERPRLAFGCPVHGHRRRRGRRCCCAGPWEEGAPIPPEISEPPKGDNR